LEQDNIFYDGAESRKELRAKSRVDSPRRVFARRPSLLRKEGWERFFLIPSFRAAKRGMSSVAMTG